MDRELDTLSDLLLFTHLTKRVFQDEVMAHFKGCGMNSARMGILHVLARRGKQSVNHLASFLGISKAAASQNTDLMVRLGFVRRKTDTRDRRTTWVEITVRGEEILEDAQRRLLDILRKFLVCLLPEARLFVVE